MTIQSVSSVGSTTGTSIAGISQMKRQIAALERQITSERQSTDDAATKAKKIQALQLQIQQLRSQILQMEVKAKEQADTKFAGSLAEKAA